MIDQGILRGRCVHLATGIVGFSLAKRSTREVTALFVLAEYEGRGYGTLLLEAAVKWLTEDSHKPIRLNTGPDTTALLFYKKRGWQEKGWVEDRLSVLNGDVVMELKP